jgi:hypothetical protein
MRIALCLGEEHRVGEKIILAACECWKYQGQTIKMTSGKVSRNLENHHSEAVFNAGT